MSVLRLPVLSRQCSLCLRKKATALNINNKHRGNRNGIRVKSTNSSVQYCVNVVRKLDYENYLACLLLPTRGRGAAFAIRAFNAEVSQIEDLVTDSRTGLMRIEFWRNALDLIFQGSPPEHPIAAELARAHVTHKLTKRWLTRMLEAREESLRQERFQNLAQLDTYSEKVFTSPLLLLLETLDIRDVQADHAASHIGKAMGLTTALRAVPYHTKYSRVRLPTHVLMEHNVSEQDILRASKDQKVKDAFFAIASAANTHLELARSMRETIPKGSHLAFLPSASCSAYLKALQRVEFDVFNGALQQRNNWLPLIMLLQKYKRTF